MNNAAPNVRADAWEHVLDNVFGSVSANVLVEVLDNAVVKANVFDNGEY